MPDSSISYIWQVTGCQHTLQPTDNDFAPPTVPALTPRGFSRWESVEILLGPEEHVPFLQYAVKNWNLRHPETGEFFPTELPASVFPSVADEEVDLWHKSCGERLTREAAGRPPCPTRPPTRPGEPEPVDPKFAPRHSRNASQNGTPQPRQNESDYFGRPFSYVNAPPNGGRPPKSGPSSRSPEKQSRNRSFNERVRRRSFSDFASPSSKDTEPDDRYPHDDDYLDPDDARRSSGGRRHSHPRHYSSDEDMEPEPTTSRGKRRQASSPTPGIRRFSPPGSGHGNGPSSSSRPHRPEGDLRKRTGPSPLGSLRSKLSETVSSILPNGLSSDRSRPNSRSKPSEEHLRQRRSREQVRPARLNRSHSDIESDHDSDHGPADAEPRRRRRPDDRDRDRDRYRDRGRFRSDTERDEERDAAAWRDRQYDRRPEPARRTSSHADIDRRRDQDGWDLRDRDRLKDERKKWDRERERRSPPEENLATPPLNVPPFSRRHPEPAYS